MLDFKAGAISFRIHEEGLAQQAISFFCEIKCPRGLLFSEYSVLYKDKRWEIIHFLQTGSCFFSMNDLYTQSLYARLNKNQVIALIKYAIMIGNIINKKESRIEW